MPHLFQRPKPQVLTAMQPFRFFDLPVELQQHILGLYYGNTATMKARIETTFSYDEFTGSYAESSKPIYKTTIRISPFLVSRRFNNEALYASERAENNIMTSICPFGVTSLPHHFLLHTVANARVPFPSEFDLAVLREKLPKLKTLHLQFGEESWATSWLHPQYLAERYPDTHATLADVLRGKHDEKLATATRESLFAKMSTMGVDTTQCLRGITITCQEDLELYGVYEWDYESIACEVEWQTLCVEYEFKDGEACVKAKWFNNGRANSGPTKTPEEAVRLIEKYCDR